MADDQKTIPPTDKIAISLALDTALKAYRETYGADRYLQRLEHAVRLATLAVASEEHGRINASR